MIFLLDDTRGGGGGRVGGWWKYFIFCLTAFVLVGNLWFIFNFDDLQKGDRAIKLYCFFEVGDKTVTNGYDVIADTIKPGNSEKKLKQITKLNSNLCHLCDIYLCICPSSLY